MTSDLTTRRRFGRLAVAAAVGAAASAAGLRGVEEFQERRPSPLYDGYAASVHGDRRTRRATAK